MAEWLILRMPREAGAPASWLVADSDGRMLVPTQSGALAEAATHAAGRRVTVLVPASEVLITFAELPPKASPAKLAQIVPFALEEQLADDVDELHFAVGQRHGEAPRTPVAVVSRALLGEWLAALAAVGITPASLHAESDLLPVAPGQTTALLEGDALTVCRLDAAPIALPADALSEAFEFAEPPLASDAVRAPTSLVLYVSPEDWMRREADAEPVRARYAPFKVQLLPNGPLPLFAQQLVLGASIDLLQGAFGQSKSAGGGFAPWRLAAVLALCLVGLHVAGKAVELNRLKKSEHQVDSSIDTLARSALPGEQVGADVRQRMEQRLAAVRAGGGSGGFLAALAALAQAKGSVPAASLESLSFSAGTLELKVAAPDAASLDRMSQQLRTSGLQSDLTSGSAHGSAYEGRLQVKLAGGHS